MRSMMKHLSPG